MFPLQFFMFFMLFSSSYPSLSQGLAKLCPSRLCISSARSCLRDGGENMKKIKKNIKNYRSDNMNKCTRSCFRSSFYCFSYS